MKNEKLKGKVAVVMGPSNGIGAAIAKEFVAEGAFVIDEKFRSINQTNDRVIS
jgi:NAD(P)-dependent dehydrogenase (short-subunit alcohol dehydrogenase family)